MRSVLSCPVPALPSLLNNTPPPLVLAYRSRKAAASHVTPLHAWMGGGLLCAAGSVDFFGLNHYTSRCAPRGGSRLAGACPAPPCFCCILVRGVLHVEWAGDVSGAVVCLVSGCRYVGEPNYPQPAPGQGFYNDAWVNTTTFDIYGKPIGNVLRPHFTRPRPRPQHPPPLLCYFLLDCAPVTHCVCDDPAAACCAQCGAM